jgi:hypothetical protein
MRELTHSMSERDARRGRPPIAGAPPLLVTNPSDDVDFRDYASSRVDGTSTPRDLEAALRQRYPAAIVHLRMLSGETRAVWYVYRDGRWVGRREGDEGASATSEDPG